MEAKDILAKVKEFFAELTAAPAPATPAAPAAAVAPVALTDYELKIGGKVQIDKLEVGGIVTIDGAPSLPGDIELMDGTKITVADNGVIAEIMPVAAADPGMDPAGDMGARFSAFETTATEKFANYEQKFAAYENRFLDYENKLARATKVIDGLIELTGKLAETPAAAPDPAAGKFGKDKKEKDEPVLKPALFS